MPGSRMFASTVLAAAGLALGAAVTPALAQSAEDKAARAELEASFGLVPTFYTILPEAARPAAWEALRDLEFNENTAIPQKYKTLIGIAVAAQIPCQYCLYMDGQDAKMNGITDGEVSEALGMAANTRTWSTILNGNMIDMADFKADVAGILAYADKMQGKPAPPPMAVTDAASAYKDMEANLGRVPGFLKAYPAVGIAGAWKEFKALELNPNTAVPGKYKELIGLAVASQIPCTYCIEAHTAFAKHAGATQEEIAEAVAMSALTRHWSTLLNGNQQDMTAFRGETDRMLKFAMTQARSDK